MVKQVSIRRREVVSDKDPRIVAMSKRVLGAVLVGQGPLRGVDSANERKYVAQLLGIDPSDPGYSQKVRNFWNDIRLEVPSDGVELNVAVDADGEPINLDEWIKWQWCLRHPLVANNRQEMDKNSKKQYYIHDPEYALEQENRVVKVRRDAYRSFAEVIKNTTLANAVLRLLGMYRPELLDEKNRENEMDKILNQDPQKFLDVTSDKDLPVKSLIEDLVQFDVLRKVGSQYYFNDDKLGNNLEDTVKFFKDERENSSTIVTLKAKLVTAKASFGISGEEEKPVKGKTKDLATVEEA